MTETPLARWEGATAEELAAEWRVPQVHLFRLAGSTNEVARRLAGTGAPHLTVVLAEEQLAGRGRAGRRWASVPALGCWVSLLVRPAALTDPGLLPLLVGLATADALDPFARPAVVQLKWPNDLLLGGRKLGGILCEGVWEAAASGFVVVGIGLNLLHAEHDFPAELRPHATSLQQETARAVARRAAARAVIPAVAAALSEPVRALEGGLAADLERRDALRGREVEVSQGAGTPPLQGLALGISPDGALLVRSSDGALRRVWSGTVRLQGQRRLAP